MLKELLISVVSGIVVALVLQMFRLGGERRERDSSRLQHRASNIAQAPQVRRRSGGGGFGRFVMAVIGGLILAVVAAPFVMDALHGHGGRGGGWGGGGPRGRFYDGGGPGGYFDRGGDGIFGLPPLLVLTIICTIIIWVLLSAMRRR
jgi:hypothetical protein